MALCDSAAALLRRCLRSINYDLRILCRHRRLHQDRFDHPLPGSVSSDIQVNTVGGELGIQDAALRKVRIQVDKECVLACSQFFEPVIQLIYPRVDGFFTSPVRIVD